MPQTIPLPGSQDAGTLRWQPILLWCLFFLSLQQLTVMIGVSGVHIEYFFLFLFLIPLRRIVLTRPAVSVFIVYAIIFLSGAPAILTGDPTYSIRVTASFLAFLAPLSMLLVKFEEGDLALFKSAIVWAAVYYSASSLYTYFIATGFSIYTLKLIVGSQRYGFVLLLAFFLAIYSTEVKGLLKAAVIGVIFVGALLTFSRATLVSMLGAGVFAMLIGDWRMRVGLRWSTVGRALFIVFALAALGFYAADRFGQYWTFVEERLIQPLLSGRLAAAFLSFNYYSSEGARAYLTSLILDYLTAHPWMGSNYAGLYLLYEQLDGRGATHNQMTDVLLRTGAIGFAVWLWLLARIVLFFRRDRALLSGLIAVLIYGMFHETFKLGHGAFIFGFLLSYQFWMRRRQAMAETESRGADGTAVPLPGHP